MDGFKRDKYIFSGAAGIIDVGEKAVSIREEQITALLSEMLEYNVFLKDLISHFPSDKEKNLILNIAYYLIEDLELFDEVSKNKELAFVKLSRMMRIEKDFLREWQDYILVYFIILSNPNYKYIQDCLKIEVKEDMKSEIPIEDKVLNTKRGLAIKVGKKDTIIMTATGEFRKIKNQEEISIGYDVEGIEKKGFVHYKLQIAIGLIILLALGFAAYKDYNKVNSTVIINSTSQVKLEINKGNRVIYTHSATDKGNEMLEAIEPMDKKIDDALKDCVEYAKENDMIPKDGITVTITGQALKYGVLEKTGEYVLDNKVQIQINNAGSLHNIYESTEAKRKDKEESE